MEELRSLLKSTFVFGPHITNSSFFIPFCGCKDHIVLCMFLNGILCLALIQ
jgi:hypothetical protein